MDTEDRALKRKTMKRFVLIGVPAVVLVAIIIGCISFAVVHSRGKHSPLSTSSSKLTPATSLSAVCSVTSSPDSYISSISKIPLSSNTTDPEVFFRLSLKVAIDELSSISGLPSRLSEETNDELFKLALSVCVNVFDLALDSLNDTVSSTNIDDIMTWLSAAVTYHDTCLDALDELSNRNQKKYANSTISLSLKSAMRNSTEYTSNSLSIAAHFLSTLSGFGLPIHSRRLLNSNPEWVKPGVRRSLQANNLTPNVTVAADGSGDVRTVSEALAKVPDKGKTTFVIYVKSGTYVENVHLTKKKWNVLIYGDGKDKTIISGSKNNANGVPTLWTGTLIIEGKGFMMKDIGIINTAGPAKAMAVALRSESDRSIFYQCSFDGYQDTLYPHAKRQFYKNCDITGTVDFICGNAAVVFQDCNIQPRQPLPGQYNIITAQSKVNRTQTTGFSIQRCTISPNGNVTARTYLGRPWREYSTTVIMQTKIEMNVEPVGWLAWDSKHDPPTRILYGEYKNTGPGSDVSRRVKWAIPSMSDAEAEKFTVASFLRGDDNWLPSNDVPYQATL